MADKEIFYDVTIKATVTKVVRVKATNSQIAVELAHGEFNILSDGSDEKYTEDAVLVVPLENE